MPTDLYPSSSNLPVTTRPPHSPDWRTETSHRQLLIHISLAQIYFKILNYACLIWENWQNKGKLSDIIIIVFVKKAVFSWQILILYAIICIIISNIRVDICTINFRPTKTNKYNIKKKYFLYVCTFFKSRKWYLKPKLNYFFSDLICWLLLKSS